MTEIPELLGPGADPMLNACVNVGTDEWILYARGYRRAAEIMTEYVANELRDQDLVIYPVLFAWRHHIELQLKALARSASRLLRRDWRPAAQHDTAQLFGEVRALLGEAFEYAGARKPTGDLEQLRAHLRRLSSVDMRSFAFRYPEDLDGAQSLPGVSHVNYGNVSAFFTALSDSLDAVATALAVFRDWQSDMCSAYR